MLITCDFMALDRKAKRVVCTHPERRQGVRCETLLEKDGCPCKGEVI